MARSAAEQRPVGHAKLLAKKAPAAKRTVAKKAGERKGVGKGTAGQESFGESGTAEERDRSRSNGHSGVRRRVDDLIVVESGARWTSDFLIPPGTSSRRLLLRLCCSMVCGLLLSLLLSVLLGEVLADHATSDCTDDGMVATRSVR